jgi:hypothetical protein
MVGFVILMEEESSFVRPGEEETRSITVEIFVRTFLLFFFDG